MTGVWFYLKKSLNCKSSKSTEVLDPKRSRNKNRIQRNNSSRCSRSLPNLRDVIINKGNNQPFQNPNISSPRSRESSDFLNPVKYNVIINDSNKCQLSGLRRPDREGNHMVHYSHKRSVSSVSSEMIETGRCPCPKSFRASSDSEFRGSDALICQKWCEKFTDTDAAEAHHLSKHAGTKCRWTCSASHDKTSFLVSEETSNYCFAVTELVEGDSSRKIVEMICKTSISRSEETYHRISRVLKVHNMQKTIALFEDYRELVKIKASKLTKKHPRCLADGNELLRFHATTIVCSLGLNGTLGLCLSDQCGICRILRHGFPTKKESNDCIGVFTASTSNRALDSIEIEENQNISKALILCRAIAGRVHRPLENFEQNSGLSGFDSVAGKLGLHSNTEELYLLSRKALLPCFVVIFKS